MKQAFRYLSVCSGIESATVAWHPLGWQAVAYAEIDAFPSALLRHHYPQVPNLGDITQFKDWAEADFDLLVGGTPCQSFSVAGLRAGLDDPRGSLMLTFLAIAARYRPRWLVWENVPGALSSDDGRAFGALLGGLAKLGYGFAYRVLDAQYFRLAQRRKRVFVVACLGDWRSATAVLLERSCLRGDLAPSREAGARVAATITRGADSSGRGGYAGRRQEDDYNIVANAITTRPAARMAAEDTYITHALRAEGFDASEDGTGRGTPITPICFDETQITSAENRCNPMPGDPSHPLSASARAPAIAFNSRQDPDSSEERSGPLDSDWYSQSVATTQAVRRLTPRECERLQGFPDDYTLIKFGRKPVKDGPRYKALGNSKAVPVVRWIGERIAFVDSLRSAA